MKEEELSFVSDVENDGLQTGEFVPATGEIVDEDTFKILLASDIHLGYAENDPARENDSFNTFEEILKIAVSNEVDFLLLGGDLFHDNKPRPHILQRAMQLCKKYCLGSRPVSFEYVGLPERDFPNQPEPEVNYYNPNINIALPIFTIHGNHDDPIGTTKTSAVDHLAAAQLVNHFGQWNNLNRVTISPVLLTKGATKLALYGLGYMKDERLHRLMVDKKVEFVGPAEDTESWFNMFVIHQNRVKHGPKNYIPENFIPGYMDFVLWGHEHECITGVDRISSSRKTHVLQPGSPVATSLCAGEAKDKHCFLMQINRRRFKTEAIPLQTVRPMMLKDLVVKDILNPESSRLKHNTSVKERSRYLEKYVETTVNRLIDDSVDKLTGDEIQPTKPLIRVRVFYDDSEELFNGIRFSQRFADKVANEDIVMFKKIVAKRDTNNEAIDVDDIAELIDDEDDLNSHVEAIVEQYFTNARNEGKTDRLLEVLGETGLSEAVKCTVEKDDDKAIGEVIENQLDKVIEQLIKKKASEDTIEDLLEEIRIARIANAEQEKKDLEALIGNIKPSASAGSTRNGRVNGAGVIDEDSEPEIIDDDDIPTTSRRGGRGSRGGRGAAGTRGRGRGGGRGRGRGGAANRSSSNERDDDEVSVISQASSTSSTRSRGSRSKATAPDSAKKLRQTTLTSFDRRVSPRKASRAMQFDDDDSD